VSSDFSRAGSQVSVGRVILGIEQDLTSEFARATCSQGYYSYGWPLAAVGIGWLQATLGLVAVCEARSARIMNFGWSWFYNLGLILICIQLQAINTLILLKIPRKE
jgi:hypothetical protein